MEKTEGQAVIVSRDTRERIFDLVTIFAVFPKPSTTLAEQDLDRILNWPAFFVNCTLRKYKSTYMWVSLAYLGRLFML
jgi:hypothetical protein